MVDLEVLGYQARVEESIDIGVGIENQPRASEVPDEKNLSNPNDPVNKEDAMLDKKIKSICRGC